MAVISDELLAIVRCPETRTRLTLADDALLTQVNQAIAAGRLRNKGGDLLERALDGALVREDRAVLYPIVDRIPIMLADEAILVEQLADK